MLHLSTRVVAALGFHFRFDSDDPALTALVAHSYRDLPDGVEPAAVLRATTERAEDGIAVRLVHPDGTVEFCGAGRSGAGLLELVWWEVNRRARAAAGSLVLHGAAVGGPAGAVVLCGASGTGKSTLAAAAALRGWLHLSDDMAPVDVAACRVAPYARPVMVRAGGRALLGGRVPTPPDLALAGDEWFVPASEMGAEVATSPVPLAALVVLERGTAAALAPLGPAATLHAIAQQSATLATRGVAEFTELDTLVRRVPGYRATLGAPDAVLDLLAHLVGRTTGR